MAAVDHFEEDAVEAFTLLARAGIRSDHVTAATLARLLKRGEERGAIGITYSRAELIGMELHDHWQNIVGPELPDRDDLAWADIVQFVARRIRD